jgi:hypothetical protein
MCLDEFVGFNIGPVASQDLPKGYWVASMFSDQFCAIFALPVYKDGSVVDFRPLVSDKSAGLITVLQNHAFSKLIGVKMHTSKKYSADLNGVQATIIVETVADHLKRVDEHKQVNGNTAE